MNRVTVVGNGGSGKTTLSKQLAATLDLPLYHMDRIIWQPNWGRTPEDEVRAIIAAILPQERWLIDGLGPLWSVETRMKAADLTILLDYPLDHCKEWALRRTEEWRGKVRDDAPEGCSFGDKEEVLIPLLERVDREYLPRIREWAEELSNRVVWLRSPEEMPHLLERLGSDGTLEPKPQ